MSISNDRLHGGLSIKYTDPKKEPFSTRYPQYLLQTERIKSFEGQWPAHLTQKPEELAEAGFFYRGSGDSVRCFFCGGGLQNWEPGDDPWIEHARWFDQCKFLRTSQGDEFVNLIKENIAQASHGACSIRTHEQEKQFSHYVYDKGNSQVGGGNSSRHVEIIKRSQSTILTTKKSRSLKTPFKSGRKQREENSSKEFMKTATSVRAKINTGPLKGDMDVADLETDTRPYACENAAPLVPSKAEIQNVLDRVGFPTEEASASNANMTASNEHDGKAKNEGATLCSNAKSSTSKDEKARDLVTENEKLKEKNLCKICLQADFCILFLPCSHMVACAQCAHAVPSCPICREKITGTKRILFPAN